MEEDDSGDEYNDTYFQDVIKQENRFEEEKVAADGSINQTEPGSAQSYMDRCKLVGRLGPPKTELDINTAIGEIEIL